MSGEDAPRPYLENLIVPEIKTNKQLRERRTSSGKEIRRGTRSACAGAEATDNEKRIVRWHVKDDYDKPTRQLHQ
jgi:hypothetical protein